MSEETDPQETTTARPAKAGIALAAVAVLVALGAAYSIWSWRAKYNANQVELVATQWVLEQLHEHCDQIGNEHEACQTKLDATRSKQATDAARFASMEEQLAAAQAELKTLHSQRERNIERRTQFEKLSKRLTETGGSREWDITGRDGRMILGLPAETLFESGSARLSRVGEFALMEVAIALRQLDNRKFVIVGHTDSRSLEGTNASYRNNWDLSAARALAVLEFFLDAGVPANKLMMAGYGANDPVADNRTPQGRQKNRRIEIEFLPHPDELPWLFEDAGGSQPETPSPTE